MKRNLSSITNPQEKFLPHIIKETKIKQYLLGSSFVYRHQMLIHLNKFTD